MTDSIPKKVVQGLGEIGVETVKETTKQAVDMVNSVITGQEPYFPRHLSINILLFDHR